MKTPAILMATILPGAALAHGGHAPLPDALHGMSHAAPIIGGVVIATAIGLAIANRWRS